MNSARLWVIGTIHQTADASKNCRARAHGARLNCSKQFTVDEAVVTDVSSRLTQGYDLGVSGCIVIDEVAIPSPSNHAALAHDDRSHGHVARLQSALGAAQGFFHPKFVHG